MKKIFLVMLLSILFLFQNEVLASTKTLVMKYQDGVYYTRRGVNLGYSSNISSFYNIDSKVVYCIEPGVLVSNYDYLESGNTLPYSSELNSLIELIAYYGYEYKEHQTDRYRMATQALIWEKTTGQIVEYFTERYGYGDYIDISYEKNQIMNLVNNHEKLPSFANLTIDGYLGEEIILEDENFVLNEFEIVENDGNQVKIIDNKLIINSVNLKSEIVLTKKKYDNLVTIVYKDTLDKSQKVASLRPSFDITCKINLDIKGGELFLEKLDYDTKSNKTIGNATLKDAIYGIYDQSNNLITTLKTNEKGIAYFKNLALGNYKLKELKPSYGYQLDETIYGFSITKDNLSKVIKVYEKSILKKLTILKLLENPNSNSKIGEKDITFDFYFKDTNELYLSKTTDDLGYLELNLPYGNYLVKQRNSRVGYEKIDDFKIVIDENSEDNQEKELINKRKRFKLKVIKTDYETNKPLNISGIEFKIKNLETGEYVCLDNQDSGDCTFKTNEFGEFTTPFYLFGYYQLEEVENQLIDGYLWNSELVEFSFLSETILNEFGEEMVIINFSNKRVKGELVINKIGEKLVFDKNISYQEIPLEGVKINLYANEDIYALNELKHKKDELIKTLETNESGIVQINNLNLGKYYLKEVLSVNDNLVSQEKYEFELKYKDQYTNNIIENIKIKNYLPKGSLEFFKIDSETNKPLEGALIEIYKDDTLIYEGLTNEDGKIVLDNLPLGTYKIIELKSPNNYLKTDEIISFDLTKDQEFIKVEMKNNKIIDEIQVPNTYKIKSNKIELIGFSLLMMGVCLIFYILKFNQINK